MLFWIDSHLSPPIIPRAKRAIIFVVFHKIFVDYNSSIDLTGTNGVEVKKGIYRQWVEGGNDKDSIGDKYLIGLICVMEIFWEMCKDLNNQKNDEGRLVVRYFSGYLCYKKNISSVTFGRKSTK